MAKEIGELGSSGEQESVEEAMRKIRSAEWLQENNPRSLLDRSLFRITERKLRLFSVACCRLVWDVLVDQRSQNALAIAEGYADSRVGVQDLALALNDARAARQIPSLSFAQLDGATAACRTVSYNIVDGSQTILSLSKLAYSESRLQGIDLTAEVAELPNDVEFHLARNKLSLHVEQEQVRLFRDIMPNPFEECPLIDPDWLRPDILALAHIIYDKKRFEDMPILADALEEVGCINEDILNHLRSSGPHVRGCWALDLLLGKE
jgi:hypothetical protein